MVCSYYSTHISKAEQSAKKRKMIRMTTIHEIRTDDTENNSND